MVLIMQLGVIIRTQKVARSFILGDYNISRENIAIKMSSFSTGTFGRCKDLLAHMDATNKKIQARGNYEGLHKRDKHIIRDLSENHKLKKSFFYDSLRNFKKLNETDVNKFHVCPSRPSFLCDLMKSKRIRTLIGKKKKHYSQKKYELLVP